MDEFLLCVLFIIPCKFQNVCVISRYGCFETSVPFA
uniref:Uncharacterized protein n=1 Tax=Anguilla anguilla TaxID=7936 RepID=A0A0E9TBT1_ANGAN